jgi:hypothetical protein
LSPILVRPVREQLEHDRVIRQLQKDLTRRKVEVAINPGAEQNVGLGTGSRKEFPDAILFATDKGRKVLAVIEVETGESVNHLEAMAEWAHYSRLKAPFHLYVPIGSVDVARRLAADNHITLNEVFSYHQVGDLVRFASVYRTGPAFKLPDDPPAPPEPPKKPEMKAAAPAPAPVKGGKAPVAPAKPPVPAKPAATTKPVSAKAPAPAKIAVPAKAPVAVKPAPPAKPVKAVPVKAVPVASRKPMPPVSSKKAVPAAKPPAKKGVIKVVAKAATKPVAKKAAPKKGGKRK